MRLRDALSPVRCSWRAGSVAFAQNAAPLSLATRTTRSPCTSGHPDDNRVGSDHWRNITHVSTSELQFHLYWNAWVDTKSTLMRERARSGPDHSRPGDFAQFSVDSIRLANAGSDDPSGDLTPTRRFIAPDDGNADDRTVMVVSLPRPVAPGESTSVVVKWSARVPRTFDRTAQSASTHRARFSKLGVLEIPDGTSSVPLSG